MKKVGVLRFFGTNCDRDVWDAVQVSGHKPVWLWHQDRFDHKDLAAVIVPGGFSYGDYLRCGALAAKSPAMQSLTDAARSGMPILGICNGFQILCEANLLPGVLVRNSGLRFRDKWVRLKRVGECQKFLSRQTDALTLPIAHGEGRYFVEDDQVKKLFDDEQVWLLYEKNPNGSVENIAGVMNEKKNVAGLMPHPERAMADFMGGHDGTGFFATI